MTNKEAIRNLENWELFGKKIIEIDGDLGEAVRVAIKALENQESNQGDLISREAYRVAYFCDRQKDCMVKPGCKDNGGECAHTQDISHAANFMEVDGDYIEVESERRNK